MKNSILKLLLLSALCSVTLTACKKDEPEGESASFDKGGMLQNTVENMIMPAIGDFKFKINALENTFIDFQTDKTALKLALVETAWIEAYKSWQMVKIFDFGPVRDLGIKSAIGTYPTDSVKIDNNIAAGSYDLATAANADAIGLPSLDYFLFRVNALDYFIGNDNYTTYALDVIQKMKNEVDLLETSWLGYKSSFMASTGTETTSSFSLLVNEFSRDYELGKNSKLGIPLGKQSLGIQLPEYIEARRSGISLELLKSSMISLRTVYNGDSGLGFDDYLNQLERGSLSVSIDTRFAEIINKINIFNNSLEQEMATNTAQLDELYNLLSGQVVSIKTDMSSAFGVLITYQDNDSD